MKQMIVRERRFFTMAPCDAAEPWQLGFQDAATPMMQGIIDLHHDIFFFLIFILVFVLWILVRALWHFHYKKNPIPQRLFFDLYIESLLWSERPVGRFFLTFFIYAGISSWLTGSITVAECSGNDPTPGMGEPSSSQPALPLMASSPVASLPSIGSDSTTWIEATFGGEEASSVREEPRVSQETGLLADPTEVAPADEPQGWATLEPLIPREQRLEELRSEVLRLIAEGLIDKAPRGAEFDDLIRGQFECEIKLETALRSEGYTDESIRSSRADWRRAAYHTDAKPAPIPGRNLVRTMSKHPDIKTSLYFKRIIRGVEWGAIRLRRGA